MRERERERERARVEERLIVRRFAATRCARPTAATLSLSSVSALRAAAPATMAHCSACLRGLSTVAIGSDEVPVEQPLSVAEIKELQVPEKSPPHPLALPTNAAAAVLTLRRV